MVSRRVRWTYYQFLVKSRPVDSEGRPVRIANVLRAKGSVVATVPPDALVTVMLAQMAKHRVGAVVVVDDGAVVGTVWERDIIRLLHERGASLVQASVLEIMNTDVISCMPTDEVDGVLRIMTDRRIRHLPVMVGDKLSGIVSMGDLVNARIDELETNRAYLQSYIGAGRYAPPSLKRRQGLDGMQFICKFDGG
jgi:CBS domain-containing protein